MKILTLRLKNLNSLYGEWFIDFTDPAYHMAGLFALTGPTGAGKSTLLDAICLALYGQTPRLGKITASANEIMSRHTGECHAEVLFESQAGRFLCYWEQHRAHKKADGKLAEVTHEISDATQLVDVSKAERTACPLIENKKSRVKAIIEEKTALDFERFTRSMLLAQGRFDTFLKANDEQKSGILEQITGTAIYSDISKRTHERQRAEQEILKSLQAEISGIALLEPEQATALQADLLSKQQQATALDHQVQQTQQTIQWLKTLNDLNEELKMLAKAEQQLHADVQAFKPQQQQLERARQAAELDGHYAHLCTLRTQQHTQQTQLSNEQGKLPTLEQRCVEQQAALQQAQQRRLNALQTWEQAQPLIQKIRLLDQALDKQQQDINIAENNCQTILDTIQHTQQQKKRLQTQYNALKPALQHIQDYLDTQAKDEWLVSHFSGIEAQLKHLIHLQDSLETQENNQQDRQHAVNETDKRLQQLAYQQTQLEQAKARLKDVLSHEKTVLENLLAGRLLREYRTEHTHLQNEKVMRVRIAQLEEHRGQLEAGQACPLCGSTTHPFVQGAHIPTVDDIDEQLAQLNRMLQAAETQQERLQQLEAEYTIAQQQWQTGETQLSLAQADKDSAVQKQRETHQQWTQSQQHALDLQQELLRALQPLGITKLHTTQPHTAAAVSALANKPRNNPISDINTLLSSLQHRLEHWQDRQRQKTKLEQQAHTLNSDIKHLDGILESQTHNLANAQAHLETCQQRYQEKQAHRQTEYADKDPDSEAQQLQQALQNAEQAEKKASEHNQQAQHPLYTSQNRIADLNQRLAAITIEREQCTVDFSRALTQAGFAAEAQFLAARLPKKARDALAKQATELHNQLITIKAQQQAPTQRLQQETARSFSYQSLGIDNSTNSQTAQPSFPADHHVNSPLNLTTLQSALNDRQQHYRQLNDEIATHKHQLQENQNAQEQIKGKQQAIHTQKQTCQHWDSLHALIGSADGKRYRNFAQGLTFDLMVAHANQQLSKMTDRYLLNRAQKHSLELHVIDNYQAGEIRSTRNLSGGESFIISLALALGLSQMASRTVRVDSLFLDEGFGTLDEETLETALEALAALQHDGKLIGIISHVASLQERISTQIRVKPLSAGKSTLSGPGCRAGSL